MSAVDHRLHQLRVAVHLSYCVGDEARNDLFDEVEQRVQRQIARSVGKPLMDDMESLLDLRGQRTGDAFFSAG